MGFVIVLVVAVVAVVAVVYLVARGGTPEDSATHAGERESRAEVAGRSVAGPADAGAEAQETRTDS